MPQQFQAGGSGANGYDAVPTIIANGIPHEVRAELAFEAIMAPVTEEFRETLKDIRDDIGKLGTKVEKNYDWVHSIIYGAPGVDGLAAKVQSLETDRDALERREAERRGQLTMIKVGIVLALFSALLPLTWTAIHWLAKSLG